MLLAAVLFPDELAGEFAVAEEGAAVWGLLAAGTSAGCEFVAATFCATIWANTGWPLAGLACDVAAGFCSGAAVGIIAMVAACIALHTHSLAANAQARPFFSGGPGMAYPSHTE